MRRATVPLLARAWRSCGLPRGAATALIRPLGSTRARNTTATSGANPTGPPSGAGDGPALGGATGGAAVLRAMAGLFREAQIPDPQDSAHYLLGAAITTHLTPPPPTSSAAHSLHGVTLSPAELQRLRGFVARRLNREPVQYIVGSWPFHDIDLVLRAPVLIPRPETEQLCQMVLESIPSVTAGGDAAACRVLDVGAGCGAIGLAIASARPACLVSALDVDPRAVQLATDNAQRLGLAERYSVHEADMRDFEPGGSSGSHFDVVVSNPPYIPSAEVPALQPEVSRFESGLALDGGSDGLDLVRVLLRQAPAWLKPGGTLWLEVDSRHPAAIRALVETDPAHWHWDGCQTHRDWSGRDRFCSLHRKSST